MSNQTESSSSMSPPAAVLGGESRKRKRRKLEKSVIDDRTRWRSESEQRIYSTKLLDALRLVHHKNQNDFASASSYPFSSSSNTRNVRAAADRVLAVTAKGRTRWSRAILKRRRFRSKILKKVNKKNPNKSAPSKTGTSEVVVRPEVEKRVRVLGRLVPGCRKVSLPNLLEETTDYIAALEMQVRAMSALAQLLAGGGGAGVGTSGSNLTSGS